MTAKEKETQVKLRNYESKLKSLRRLVVEWESQLPVQFYMIIKAILNN